MLNLRSHIDTRLDIGIFDEDSILALIDPRPTDILLVAGSLIDGSGTPTSDFDFCVISETEDDRFHRDTFSRTRHMRYYTSGARVKASFDYLPDSLIGVDVEYRTIREIETLFHQHRTLYRHAFARARKMSSFSSTGIDFRLLSRLTYAVPLTNPTQFQALAAAIKHDEICYTAFRTSVGSFPDFRDIAGLWLQRDYVLALVLARKLAQDTLLGLTHLMGQTNRNAKYLPRFIDRLGEDCAQIKASYAALFPADIMATGSADCAALAWLDLTDLAFDMMRAERDDRAAFPKRAEFCNALKRELHSAMNWHHEIDREYAFRAREAIDGMPSLRALLLDTGICALDYASLPFRNWSKANLITPEGENGNAFSSD